LPQVAQQARRIAEYFPQNAEVQEFAQLATAAIELSTTR